MGINVGEIFVALGFDVDDEGIKKFIGETNESIASLTKFAAKVSATVVVIDRMTNSMLKNNQAFINFNRQTGLSIDKLQRLAAVGSMVNYGMSPETVTQSVQALQSQLAQIRLGQGSVAPFQMLGISPIGKDAFQVIDELRGAISGLDDMTAVNLIGQMGLGPEFITMLRMSKSEMESFNDEFFLDEAHRQALTQMSAELAKMHMQLSLLKDKALIAIMPYLIDFLESVVHIGNFVEKLSIKINTLVEGLLGVKDAIGIIGTAFAVALISLNPFLAAMTALYIIMEDIAVWALGGKSMMGTAFDKLKDMAPKLPSIPGASPNNVVSNNNFYQTNQMDITTPNGQAGQIVGNQIGEFAFAMTQMNKVV